MNKAVWLIPSFCAVTFAQTLPGSNAASGNLQKRLESFTLTTPDMSLRLAKPLTSVCAIPLITVVPTDNYRMPVIKPPAPTPDGVSRSGIVRPPMEACNPRFFRNK